MVDIVRTMPVYYPASVKTKDLDVESGTTQMHRVLLIFWSWFFSTSAQDNDENMGPY